MVAGGQLLRANTMAWMYEGNDIHPEEWKEIEW
jgi:hypothetical protein